MIAMKKFLTIAVLILAPTIVAQARIVRAWSYQELYDQSDLIVIAKFISSERTAEQWVLPNISQNLDVVGLSSNFLVFLGIEGRSECEIARFAPLSTKPCNRRQTNSQWPDVGSL